MISRRRRLAGTAMKERGISGPATGVEAGRLAGQRRPPPEKVSALRGRVSAFGGGDRRSGPEPIDRSPVGGHAEPSFLGNKYRCHGRPIEPGRIVYHAIDSEVPLRVWRTSWSILSAISAISFADTWWVVTPLSASFLPQHLSFRIPRLARPFTHSMRESLSHTFPMARWTELGVYSS